MSRFQVEDLTSVETLTPEQEELIQGAGLQSFRPTLEGLEDRQLMASHLADALPMPPPAVRPAALDGPALVASANPEAEIVPTSSAPRALAVSADASFVESQVRAILKDQIIGNDPSHGKLSNPWALNNCLLTLGPSLFKETGNKIEVSYRLQYGSPTRECVVWMVIEGNMRGGDKVYALKSAGLVGWESQWFNFWVSPNGFEDYARAKFGTGVHINKFDTNRFVQNILRQAENIKGAPPGSFRADQVTPIDGGLRVVIWVGEAQSVAKSPYFQFEFKYGDADLEAGWVKLTSAENGEMHCVGDHFNFWSRREVPALDNLYFARWWLAEDKGLKLSR
jgi:hypothetical protein